MRFAAKLAAAERPVEPFRCEISILGNRMATFLRPLRPISARPVFYFLHRVVYGSTAIGGQPWLNPGAWGCGAIDYSHQKRRGFSPCYRSVRPFASAFLAAFGSCLSALSDQSPALAGKGLKHRRSDLA